MKLGVTFVPVAVKLEKKLGDYLIIFWMQK